MKRWCLFFPLLLTTVNQAQAVSEAGVLFLLIQPSARANSMAGASVASAQHDALLVAFNPAHLGFAAFERSFSLEFYPQKNKMGFIDDINYDAKAIMVGFDFRRLNKRIPVSVGFSYSSSVLNLGEQIWTDENGNILGTFRSSENADIWSIGLAVDYYLKVGVGLNFKNIDSNLSPIGPTFGQGAANARDVGLLIQLPIIETLSKISNRPMKIGNSIEPFLSTTFGLSRSNVGDEIIYIDAAQPTPLPRVARMGLSFQTGISYLKGNRRLRVLSLECISEAEDLLVQATPSGGVKYEDGFGDIGFVENVLKLNGGSEVVNSHGWELSLFDIVAYRQGRNEDPEAGIFFDTSGYGINFIGILRLLNIINPEFGKDGVFNFISNHVDIQFNHGSLDAGRSLIAEPSFNGLVIRLF